MVLEVFGYVQEDGVRMGDNSNIMFASQPDGWADPGVIASWMGVLASLAASVVALTIAVSGNRRSDRIREEDRKTADRKERERLERADLAIASQVKCITMTLDGDGDKFLVILINYSSERVCDIKLWTTVGSAVFSPVSSKTSSEIDLDLTDFPRSQWKDMDFYFSNGAGQIAAGGALILECVPTCGGVFPERVTFSYIVPSGRSYAHVGNTIQRAPENDITIGDNTGDGMI